ncbi:MAG: hypothetical protein IPI28_07325 [Candidatus Omnitrophica bacterium]|nr:hypothetical protein [Candidatus Omnitrophota bacterium]
MQRYREILSLQADSEVLKGPCLWKVLELLEGQGGEDYTHRMGQTSGASKRLTAMKLMDYLSNEQIVMDLKATTRSRF